MIYFRKMACQRPCWYAYTSSGNFLAAVVKDGESRWRVETGPPQNPVAVHHVPLMEDAFDFVSDQLAGTLDVR